MKILLWDQDFFHQILFKSLAEPVADVQAVKDLESAKKTLSSQPIDLIFLGKKEDLEEALKLGVPVIAHAKDTEENLTMYTLGAKATLNKDLVLDHRFIHFLTNSKDCFCP